MSDLGFSVSYIRYTFYEPSFVGRYGRTLTSIVDSFKARFKTLLYKKSLRTLYSFLCGFIINCRLFLSIVSYFYQEQMYFVQFLCSFIINCSLFLSIVGYFIKTRYILCIVFMQFYYQLQVTVFLLRIDILCCFLLYMSML